MFMDKVTLKAAFVCQVCASPMVWDDSETVPGLSIPDADLSCEAAAGQQHPITGQTLNVLRDTKEISQTPNKEFV